MNRQSCEREDQTSAAVSGRTLNPEIVSHAQQCSICSDILLVAGFLQNNEVLRDLERIVLPHPGLIWQTARSQANQESIRLALRPIRFMKIMACIAFACSPGLRLVLPIGRELSTSWSRTVDSTLALFLKTSLSTSAETAILLGFSGTVLCLGLSSWYILREE